MGAVPFLRRANKINGLNTLAYKDIIREKVHKLPFFMDLFNNSCRKKGTAPKSYVNKLEKEIENFEFSKAQKSLQDLLNKLDTE
ncbi:MAG: hypothetical protein HQK77_18905 [Desulfobacterales bacterium]|nr:hypothetical protein [Desulfobacterales bacterium]